MVKNNASTETEVTKGATSDKNSASAGVSAGASAEASSKRGLGNGTTGEAKTETHVVAEAGVSAEAKNGNANLKQVLK